ncbi:MAG TPA: hypothetical protein VGD78_09680 [Chthoniobacterales bacterium]
MSSARFLSLLFLAYAACGACGGFGQDPTVPGTPLPSLPGDVLEPQPSPAETATPAPTPEKAAPDLLPESGALPSPSASPPAQAVPDLIPNLVAPRAFLPPEATQSVAQKLKDAIRFRELRSLAERSPYAIWLLQTADRTQTAEGRRQYLRAYYRYTTAAMLRTEPRLAPMIKAYGNARIQSTLQHNLQPTIPSYEFTKEGQVRQPVASRGR